MSSEQVHRENSTSLYFIKKRTILNLVKLEKKWKSARVMFPVLLSVPKQNRPNVNVCRWSSHLSPTHANPSLSIFFFSKSKIAHFGDPRCLFFPFEQNDLAPVNQCISRSSRFARKGFTIFRALLWDERWKLPAHWMVHFDLHFTLLYVWRVESKRRTCCSKLIVKINFIWCTQFLENK